MLIFVTVDDMSELIGVLAVCQVSLNSVHLLHRRNRKYISRSEAWVVIFYHIFAPKYILGRDDNGYKITMAPIQDKL